MNDIYLSEIIVKRGYLQKNEALKTILLTIFSKLNKENVWDKQVNYEDINIAIDEYLITKTKERNAERGLEALCSAFGDKRKDYHKVTVLGTIREIIDDKETFLNNIKGQY